MTVRKSSRAYKAGRKAAKSGVRVSVFQSYKLAAKLGAFTPSKDAAEDFVAGFKAANGKSKTRYRT